MQALLFCTPEKANLVKIWYIASKFEYDPILDFVKRKKKKNLDTLFCPKIDRQTDWKYENGLENTYHKDNTSASRPKLEVLEQPEAAPVLLLTHVATEIS